MQYYYKIVNKYILILKYFFQKVLYLKVVTAALIKTYVKMKLQYYVSATQF